MPNPDQPNVPSENPQPPRPTVLGLPPLPDELYELAVKYLPLLVLAMAAFSAITVIGDIIQLGNLPVSTSPAMAYVTVCSELVVAVLGFLAYLWLKDGRRLGWNTLVVITVIQFLTQLITSGASALLGVAIGVLFTAYVMLQLRDEYSQP